MNRVMKKNAATDKFPISDYLRVGGMAFVILLTIMAVKLISLLFRDNGKGLLDRSHFNTFNRV